MTAKRMATDRPLRWRGHLTEALIGLALSAAITLAALTSIGEIPLVYQGY